MRDKLKGVSPVISSILIVGVLATVTGVAYQWGLPLIQKNLDITTLNKAEDFFRLIDKKVDGVAVSGNTEEIVFNLPGEIRVDPENDKIEFSFETSGSIYAPGGFVCFSRDCNLEEGTWGEDSYSVIGARVEQSGEYYTLTTFSITQRNLTSAKKSYRRDIITPGNATISGGENSKLIISKESEERINTTTRTIIRIDLI